MEATIDDLFRELVEFTLDPVFTCDVSGRYLFANRAAAADLGLAQADVVGRTIEELFPPRVAAEFRAGLTYVIHTGETLKTEHLSEINGRSVWLQSAIQPLRDGQGQIVGVHGTARDVTRAKEAEQALRESEERLRQAVDLAAIGIFEYDHAADRLYLSPKQRAIDGVGPDVEVVVRQGIAAGENAVSLEALVHPDDWARVRAAIERAADPAGDGLYEVEHRRRRPDGTVRWVLARAQTFFEGEGAARHPTRSVGATRDITEEKAAAAELEATTAQFRLLADHVPAGMVHVDRKLQIRYGNRLLTEWFATSLPALMGHSIEENVPPEMLDDFRPAIEATLAGETTRVEQQLRFPDGRTRWVDSIRVPDVGDDGVVRGYFGLMVDISDRKRTEEQLLQAQKLDAIGRLAGGVAHDFNNMLTVIVGSADLLLRQIPKTDPNHSDVQQIHAAGKRSAALTSQLLAFARRQPVRPAVVDLNETLGRSLTLLARLIGDDIELVWTPASDLWPVRIDPSQVDQIVTNMVINAREAITGVGRVAIRTANVTLDAEAVHQHADLPLGDYVELEVSDTGMGMDETTRAHAFEPFYTTKPEARGTGLGLATVYGIVRQNAGGIRLISAPDMGTTISVLLPRVAEAVVRVGGAVEPPAVATGTETILLVEDQEMVLGLSQRMLEDLGYQVLPAATPEEAIRLAATHKEAIQLLFTDVVMPLMSGPSLARRLVAAHPHLKCMFATGYAADELSPSSALPAAALILQKPFTREVLAAKVREALESS